MVASHSRAVVSSPAVATSLPSGLNEAPHSAPDCPWIVSSRRAEPASQILAVPSRLLVSSICARTGAAKAGLHAGRQEVTVAGSTWPLGGDIVVKADGSPVGSVDEFRKIVGGLKPGESVPVQLQRGGGGGREYVVLKAPEKP